MSRVCFFTSIGNNIDLLYNIKTNYDYDIICNYYENDSNIFNQIQKLSVYSENHTNCKFPSLKIMYDHIKNYDYVFVYDDDAIVKTGNLNSLIEIAYKYNLDIVSPAHDPKGKITWKIHLPINSYHIFRYVNFVEINFPIFSQNALNKLMSVYDIGLCDYGIDHWYTHLLQPMTNKNMAIVDSVIIHNPKNSIKLNQKVHTKIRLNQMNFYLKKYCIPLVQPRTLGYKY